MSKIWLTADPHLGHYNILKHCNRPFESIDEMNRTILTNWYESIDKDDYVYVLGDFYWNSKFKNPISPEFVERYGFEWPIPGHKILIRGNHDHNDDLWIFDDVEDLDCIRVTLPDGNKHPLVMCHYSMRIWPEAHYGALHAFGHSHGTIPGYGRSMDVGVDTNDFRPYSLDEVVARLSVIDYKPTHGVGECRHGS